MRLNGNDLIALGEAFLRGIHSVFDLEGNRVGCKFFSHFCYC